MPSLMNAYTILEDVRYGINEYSTAYMQATDTTGAYKNVQLMRFINRAQLSIHSFVFIMEPDLFLTSTTLTGVASVYTLPADFHSIRRFEDSDGNMIRGINLNHKRVYGTGSKWEYYRKGNTLIVNRASITDVNTLWYYTEPRKLEQGKASAGAATSITLATTARKEADYYNGMTIENITKDWTDVIDDYSAARVATISETAAANDYYGIVPEMPEEFHHLIAAKAILLARKSIVSLKTPTRQEELDYMDDLRDVAKAFGGTQFDVSFNDIFTDFEPML